MSPSLAVGLSITINVCRPVLLYSHCQEEVAASNKALAELAPAETVDPVQSSISALQSQLDAWSSQQKKPSRKRVRVADVGSAAGSAGENSASVVGGASAPSAIVPASDKKRGPPGNDDDCERVPMAVALAWSDIAAR